jgi:hypothetical protein
MWWGVGQLICEQIREYTVGILSMEPSYMSPEEVYTSCHPHSGIFVESWMLAEFCDESRFTYAFWFTEALCTTWDDEDAIHGARNHPSPASQVSYRFFWIM